MTSSVRIKGLTILKWRIMISSKLLPVSFLAFVPIWRLFYHKRQKGKSGYIGKTSVILVCPPYHFYPRLLSLSYMRSHK